MEFQWLNESTITEKGGKITIMAPGRRTFFAAAQASARRASFRRC